MSTPIAKEIKQQILSRAKEGVSVSKLSREHGVSIKTIYTWLGKQTTANPSALKYNRLKRERDELFKLVGKLTMDLSKEKRGR